ncbi:UpxY family transcription antiterminator [Maribacter polysaccharolyticus]|uniref:UpxY family transcription antiterminator n=1 Tax=Maribacter polysaccharolyticus TaxID=3020831 RepID=UPI00237F7749|nr:UpxY family transcription antiterminator [Maribacter polysaccharolyticus]MDE3741466.1 UpxY family transcription antiterminator [Maribacter polysaccharolyticus]
MKWYVLYVKPKSEKKVAELLRKMGIEVYCPLVKEVRQWSDRKKTVENPLFKSYVFVRLNNNERQMVFAVPGVVRYLFWLGKPAVVRDEEIQAIENWLTDDAIEDITLSKLVPGDELHLKNGILKDHKAIIQKVGKKRIRLVIPGLGMVLNARIKDVV